MYHRTRAQKNQDRHKIAEMLGQNFNLQQIKDELDKIPGRKQVGLVAIQRDSKVIIEQWMKEHADTLDIERVKMVKSMDKVIQEAWDQWKKSKEDVTRISAKEKTNGSVTHGTSEKGMTKSGRCGDPSYLNVVLKANEQKADLLGLKAPTQLEAVGPMSPQAVQDLRARVFGNEAVRPAERTITVEVDKE